jgi:hypothetical protein
MDTVQTKKKNIINENTLTIVKRERKKTSI